MKKLFSFLVVLIALSTQAQKTKSTTISRIIAKDSIKLGGVWRSTWPAGGSGGGTGDSTKSWSVYGNSGLSNPLLGTKSNTGVNIIANNKLLLQVNPDSTVKVKSRIPAEDSTQQVSSTGWIKKYIEKLLLFDETFNVTDIDAKTRLIGVNLDNVASTTYVDNSINNIVQFDGWALTGNAGVDTSVHFIGTTDGAALLIKSNNQTTAIFTKDTTYHLAATSLFHSNIILDTATQVPGQDADSHGIAFKGIGPGNESLLASIIYDGGAGGGSLNIANPGGQLWLNGSSLLVPTIVSSLSNMAFFINSAAGGFIMQNNVSQSSGLLLNIVGNSASRLAIDAVTGNMGVGTTTPDSTLTVNGSIKSTTTVSDANGNLRPYKVYTALLTQNGTDAPLATILENNTGRTFTFSYSNVGEYLCAVSSGNLQDDKTTIIIGQSNTSTASSNIPIFQLDKSTTSFFINSYDGNTNTKQDSNLQSTTIEIRFYN